MEWFRDNYEDYWELKEPPRSSQIDILREVDEALESGYPNIIINAGVGIGKSAIASTIANTYDNGYIATKSVSLQNQYINDFNNLVEFKGRSHYICNYLNEDMERYRTCAECYMKYLTKFGKVEDKRRELNTHGRKWEYYPNVSKEEYDRIIAELRMQPCWTDCEYLQALHIAEKSPYVVVNYHSLYYNSIIVKNRLKPRDIIVFDECHNLENIARDIIGFPLNPNTFHMEYGIDVFETNEPDGLYDIDHWRVVFGTAYDIIEEKRSDLQSQLDNIDIHFNQKINAIALKMLINEYDIKLSELNHILMTLSDDMYVKLPEDESKHKLYVKGNGIEFKPLFGKEYVKNFLGLGGVRLFLTGTLPRPGVYKKWIGLNNNNTYYYYKKSPYHVENRPIYCLGFDNFKSRFDDNGDYVWMKYENILKIKELLWKHDGKNIVIHTTSKDQTKWLYDNLKHDFSVETWIAEDGFEAIDDFKRNNYSNVLISPSVYEGVDFKGDSCTVQIILKVPYPRVDEITKKRCDADIFYLNWWTAVKLEQIYGRGIRSESDKCITYILDKEFEIWYKHKGGRMYLSEYFREAIIK